MMRSWWHFWAGCPSDQLRAGRKLNGIIVVWCQGCRRLAKGMPR